MRTVTMSAHDAVTNRTARANWTTGGTPVIRIGCQSHSLAEWRRKGKAIVNRNLATGGPIRPTRCGNANCETCRDAQADYERRAAAWKRRGGDKQADAAWRKLTFFLDAVEQEYQNTQRPSRRS